MQTESNIEILCVDDGSTDQSLTMLHNYADHDPRVKLISHSSNQGVSMARNTGLQAATGEYAAFVDSDDCLKPDFCRKLYAAARRADADIAKGNYAYRNHDRIDFSINRKIREDKTNFYIQCSSAIFRTEMLRKHGILFSPDLHASEDLLFAFTAACHADMVAVADDAHIIINTRPGSATFGIPDRDTLVSHYKALDRILHEALSIGIEKASFNYVLASLFALFIHIAAKNRDPEIRSFVIAENRRLFGAAQAGRQFDPCLFSSDLVEADKPLYACLEANTLPLFFQTIDNMQAQRCRMLRNRAHDAVRSS
jgi:glycosyltransferase involved in cell wall biosynthesis